MGFLFEPHRYKIAYGGRFGVKSWSFARALLLIGVNPELLWPGRKTGARILCARETQKSIAESVHKLLSDQIVELGLQDKYDIQLTSISAKNGTEFIFAGIRQNVTNIKSYEACDICWVEEAQTVSKNSWNVLVPTIRKEASEIWVSYNPDLETDETHQRFVIHPPTNSVVRHTTYRDNAWISNVMRQEMADLKERDPQAFDNVYEGVCKSAVEGAIYREQITKAELDGRLARVPYDAMYPVNTYWDLGYGDNTSILFAQSFPFEFRIIDHVSGSLQALSYYIGKLKEREYIYGFHVLPHDAKAHELGSGRTIEEQLRDFFPAPGAVRVAKKLSIVDGIAAARAIFNRCWIDREKCADWIQSIRHYRYEQDEKLGTFKREPLHDWASHDADAFRTMAVSIKEAAIPREKKQNYVQRTAWS